MSGFSSNFSNMPPGVGVNDIPGNGPYEVDIPSLGDSLKLFLDTVKANVSGTLPEYITETISRSFMAGWEAGCESFRQQLKLANFNCSCGRSFNIDQSIENLRIRHRS